MPMADEIEQLIREAIAIEAIDVINESYKHAGHAGDDGSGQTHFDLIIESSELKSLSRIQAHRRVNDAIKPLFSKGLHAISISVS